MRRTVTRWIGPLLVGCGIAGVDSTVRAEEQPSASDIALARTLGGEGVQLAEQGNCAAAVDKLQRAETLYHAPTILVRLGECQVALGKVVIGTENLQRVARETLAPRAPKPFVEAQARAQKSLDAALPKLARLKIHVEAPPSARPAVKLDGEAMSLAALDVDRPVDPGSHRIEVSAPGFRTAVASATVREGQRDSLSLTLEPDSAGGPPNAGGPPGAAPDAPATVVSAMPPGQPEPPPPNPLPSYAGTVSSEGGGSGKAPAYVLLAAGVVGIGVGTVFGLSAISGKGKLACPDGNSYCPADAQGDIDSMKTAATISTIGFAAGGVAAGAGLLWLLLKKSPSDSAAHASARGAQLRPFVGASSAGVWGTF